MRRRRFVAALAGGLSLTGCLAGSSETDTATPDSEGPTTTPEPAGATDADSSPARDGTKTRARSVEAAGSTASGTGTGERSRRTRTTTPTPRPHAQDAFETFAVGESNADVVPHAVAIRNESEAKTRTVTVQVTDTEADERLLDRSYDLPAGERIVGRVRSSSAYEIRVALSDHETATVEEVGHGMFDSCNSSRTTVTIADDGEVSAETMTTLVACHTATVTTPDSDE